MLTLPLSWYTFLNINQFLMTKMNLTREQLYKLVWEKPIRFIIESYGGTYVDVKELLKKYNIPSPDNGYWSKLRAGQHITIPSLPNRIENNLEKVIYVPKERKIRAKVKKQITVNNGIPKRTHIDSSIKEAKNVYRSKCKGRADDKLISIAYESFNINVSPNMLERALYFFNLFIAGVKRFGGEIEVKPHHTSLIYSGEKLEISLREKQNRIEIDNRSYSWQTYDYVPSGVLCFKVGEHSWDAKEWKDTAYTLIEDKVEDIFNFIKTIVIRIQDNRRENELRRLAHEKERQRQLELERIQTAEINDFIALKTNADLWKNAVIMREYLTVLENTSKTNGTCDVDMQKYLEWARIKVDWYDPLVNLKDDLFDKLDKITLTLPKKFGF